MKRSKNTDQIKHLYSRASFGIRYAELEKLSGISPAKAVRRLLKQAENVEPLNEVSERLQRPPRAENPSEEVIKEYLRKRNEQETAINIAWTKRFAQTEAPLLEKMTLFWHGHFACRMNDGYYLQQLNNVHRRNALGNFKTLLTEVAKAPAMLSFLNNQQNRKGRPNENFARELMELFTLGRGNYTENDVKQSARAFTGWQYKGATGDFFFNQKQHDDGSKTFFGKTGNFSGEDIIDMILEKKKTAYFISEKLYKFFVNDIPNPQHVKELSEAFYSSGYEIRPLVEKIFTSAWFYDTKNVGNKIKSPVEFLAGLNRQFNIQYESTKVLLQLQRSMGQAVFYPPNVAGWAGGQNWIDSSSLLTRMKLPSVLLNGGIIESDGKADPEDEAFISAAKRQRLNIEKRVRAQPGWELFLKEIPEEITREDLAYLLIAGDLNQEALNRIDTGNIKNMVIQLLSTPEYQLC
ncbi:uncharacterized protein (DUF1800 family) [Arcticibacter tournemirensis]|uniref:DUF1800 domain-containing protein n=1 Tax=Arcticibacter tournemirensis TaxID=699437 RepID=A0A5M9GT71_9SPHI|nr:DUF1800 domain-containing protein [Arcticibacter tournemirensis]KAA8477933.1 DUF1800 domain-containing protein [Arcticibacter tournemirensis]TQM48444.1 uncharacterized protein (DUF1800 family) [Arcticibacter tournemirensis]